MERSWRGAPVSSGLRRRGYDHNKDGDLQIWRPTRTRRIPQRRRWLSMSVAPCRCPHLPLDLDLPRPRPWRTGAAGRASPLNHMASMCSSRGRLSLPLSAHGAGGHPCRRWCVVEYQVGASCCKFAIMPVDVDVQVCADLIYPAHFYFLVRVSTTT